MPRIQPSSSSSAAKVSLPFAVDGCGASAAGGAIAGNELTLAIEWSMDLEVLARQLRASSSSAVRLRTRCSASHNRSCRSRRSVSARSPSLATSWRVASNCCLRASFSACRVEAFFHSASTLARSSAAETTAVLAASLEAATAASAAAARRLAPLSNSAAVDSASSISLIRCVRERSMACWAASFAACCEDINSICFSSGLVASELLYWVSLLLASASRRESCRVAISRRKLVSLTSHSVCRSSRVARKDCRFSSSVASRSCAAASCSAPPRSLSSSAF
mmetsp:Transcript_18990/g.52956  ORF Transcript_18990/g.52956 Transcript_18990/m.52956 type:complete len:279 (-) Transcript_18990:912-1748(-)